MIVERIRTQNGPHGLLSRMKSFIRHLCVQTVVLTACLSIVGCGPPRLQVTGKLTQGGKPIIPSKRVRQVVIVLVPEDSSTGKAYQGYFIGPDVFRIRDVPPGKYKAVIQILNAKEKDILKGEYDFESTRYVFQVDGKQEIKIDLPGDEFTKSEN